MVIDWSSAGVTDVGTVRSVNEDAYLAMDELELWAVADGMGGHSAGDFASRSIVSALSELDRVAELDDAVEQTAKTLGGVNAFLVEQAAMRGSELIGATVLVLVARGTSGCCLWAGDCRLYRLQGDRLSLLSEDHSRVQELVNSGQITMAEARSHPEANMVTRALGVTSELALDRLACEISPGDTFLLCSDGLSGVLEEQDLGDCLKQRDCASAAHSLVARALELGARDNVTAVVVKAFEEAVTQVNPAVALEADDKTLISD